MHVSSAVFGGLELHGRDIGESWLRLAQTANAGSNTIVVDGNISNWRIDDEIVITSTSYSPDETERKLINSIDSSTGTITLETPLTYTHQGIITNTVLFCFCFVINFHKLFKKSGVRICNNFMFVQQAQLIMLWPLPNVTQVWYMKCFVVTESEGWVFSGFASFITQLDHRETLILI